MTYLLLGDCAEKMRDLAPNSIDAIVTDPPYAFTGSSGSGGFMGAKWDSALPTVDMWREALRVAKPGAHLLAFGGTRTYHRLACAIEDAGWEVRDCIMWVYGSGFPKSMDVAKSIDKASGYDGKVIGTRVVDVGMQGGNMHAGRKQQQQVRALSTEAAAWSGFGTALKPAYEPIVIARKPLEGTVAANCLKYGTGAINIDACRVPTEGAVVVHSPARKTLLASGHKDIGTWENTKGRFPANLIHDGSDEVLALFPESNCGKSGIIKHKTNNRSVYMGHPNETSITSFAHGGTGSAARFFYCAKASRSERGEGNDHCTVKPLALMRYLVRLVTRKGGIVLDPFMGSGTTGVAALQEGINFVGVERDTHYYEIASRRIAEAKPEPTTPAQQELPL